MADDIGQIAEVARGFDVVAAPHPVRGELVTGVVPLGCTLAELGAGESVVAFVNGDRIADLSFCPREGDIVTLRAVAQGGSDALRFIATIAVLVVANVLAPGVGSAVGLGTNAAFVGLSIVGTLAVNALIPPQTPSLDVASGLKPFRGIERVSNRVAAFEAVPRLYGTERLYPAYAALPVPRAVGGDTEFQGLFCLGYREMVVDTGTIRLGETLIDNFEGAEYRIWDFNRDEALDEVFQFGVATDATQGGLREAPDEVIRTTEAGTTRYEIEVAGGPLGFFGEDKKWEVLVPFKVEYRTAGTSDAWTLVTPDYVAGDGGVSTNFPDEITSNDGGEGTGFDLAGDTTYDGPAAFVRGHAADVRTYTLAVGVDFPSAGQWEVRITRLAAARFIREVLLGRTTVQRTNADFANGKFRQEITLIRSRSIVPVADLSDQVDPRFAYIAISLTATDQLSGSVDDLNMVATGVVEVWNGSAWVEQVSANPAWAFRDVLMGAANARPVSAAKIDETAIIAWGQSVAAESPPREFNGLIDGRTSVFETLKNIASVGRAGFSMRDGKYSVVRDVPGLTPVQVFTPRNSWNFRASKAYRNLPHALKIKFRDRNASWRESERIVYADGYSLDGAGGTEVATRFESASIFGQTDPDLIYKDGRFMEASAKLRPETFNWECAIEHLVCQRGDVVRRQDDALLVGQGSARVIGIAGSVLTLDDIFTMELGKTYQAIIRREDATQSTHAVDTVAGDSNAITLSAPPPAQLEVGDLLVFGESGLVAMDVLITAIEPGADLTAKVRAQAYSSPAVHNADTGVIPDYETLVSEPINRPPAPVILNLDSSAEVSRENNDGSFSSRVVVSYLFPEYEQGIAFVDVELRASGGPVNWRHAGRLRNDGTATVDVIDDVSTIDLRLRGIGDNGLPGPWTYQYDYTLETARTEGEAALALVEQPNNPESPNGDLSTIIATVTPPAPEPGNYNGAVVEYRRLNDARWTRIGPTDDAGQQRVIVNSDGTTYEFRARMLNTSGVEARFGTTAQITVSVADGEVPQTDPDAGALADSALNVSNLRIVGELAAVTDFTGPDAPLAWDAVAPPAGSTIRDYRVEVIDPGSGDVLRRRYIVGTRYTYDLTANAEDSGHSGPLRQITVRVRARTTQGGISDADAAKTIQNPAPALPGDFAHGTSGNSLTLSFTRPADGDYEKAQVFVSVSSGFTASAANLEYDGAETKPITISGLAYGTAYYYRVQLFDKFGAGALSAEYTSTTEDIPGTDTVPPTVPGTPVLSSAVESAELYTRSSLDISWSVATDVNPFFYELEIWRTAEPTKVITARTAAPDYTLSPAIAGAEYQARVRAINYGTSAPASSFSATAAHTVAGDLTAPANVSNATATGGLDKNILEWDNPTDSDFLLVEVHRGTSSGFAVNAGSLIARTRNDVLVDAAVTNDTSYYYKFVAQDVSGNASAASAAVGPATPNKIGPINVDSYLAEDALQTKHLVVGDFTNLLENGDFEKGATGWSLAAAYSFLNASGTAYAGNWCLSINSASGSTSGASATNNFKIACQEGDQFYGQARIRTDTASGGNGLRWDIIFRDSDGTLIGTGNGNYVSSESTGYQLSTFNATVPSGATYAQCRILSNYDSGVSRVDQCSCFRVAGSALIANAAILSAHIADLQVQNQHVLNLDAEKITTGELDADRIGADTITANKLNVTELSAISADLGSVTAGTMTGATVQTSTAGERVQMTTALGLRTLNSSLAETARLRTNGSGFLGLSPGSIQWDAAGDVSITGDLSMSGDIDMTAGSIAAGKAEYTSTDAGYWLGFDSGDAKFHIGDATDFLKWTGTALVANNIKTATTGQRVVMSAGNEVEFYEPDGQKAVTIGVGNGGSSHPYTSSDPYIVAGVEPVQGTGGSAVLVGNNSQKERIGIQAYSSLREAIQAYSYNSNAILAEAGYPFPGALNNPGIAAIRGRGSGHAGIQGDSLSGAGVFGENPNVTSGSPAGLGASAPHLAITPAGGVFVGTDTHPGVAAQGLYGGVFSQVDDEQGGALLVKANSDITSAPTHTAESGTVITRRTGGGALIFYRQTAGGFGGSGSTWNVFA